MLRTLFITGSLPDGGAERHTLALLRSLARRGHECHAACVKAPRVPAAAIDLPSPATLFSLDARGYFDRRAAARLGAHLARLQPHVIVAANGYAMLYASLARMLAGSDARLVVVWHSTKLLGLKERLQMIAYRPLFWNSDCAVFLCHRQRRHWRHRLLTARRNEVIYNGVDTASYSVDAAREQAARLRAQLGIPAGDFLVGLPALLRPEKNHLQLIDAVACLRAHGIAVRVLLIGDGPERARIEQRARELGLSDRLTIAGLQADVRPWIAACDVITLCSVTEAFSLAALEAMSMERPVVLSDVGGAAEMVVPGWNGLLFPVGDTEAYVNCLLRLADRNTAQRMGRNARTAVEQRFTADTMTDRYEELLCALCGRAPAPRPEMVMAGNS